MLGLAQRLATGEWFTSRVSSCGAFVSAYPQAPEGSRGDLRALFAHLCRDDTPMVRRAAAQNLAAFAHIVEPDLVPAEFLPLFQHLTQDGAHCIWLAYSILHIWQRTPALSCHAMSTFLDFHFVRVQTKTLCGCWLWSAAALLRSCAARTMS